MRKVEESLDFAADARKEFEAGDTEKRRLIFSTLGWNHLLKDRKLIIQAEKPLLVIKEAAFLAKSISDRLEPPKNKALQRRIQEKYSQNPILCIYTTTLEPIFARNADAARRKRRRALTSLRAQARGAAKCERDAEGAAAPPTRRRACVPVLRGCGANRNPAR